MVGRRGDLLMLPKIQTVKERISGFLVNGVLNVPNDTLNGDYIAVQEWIADGNTPEPEFTEAEILDNARRDKVNLIKTEALTRINTAVPALSTLDMVAFLVDLWPMLDTASANADITLAKDTYVYAKTKITQAKGATQTQLDDYDPTTDLGWPT